MCMDSWRFSSAKTKITSELKRSSQYFYIHTLWWYYLSSFYSTPEEYWFIAVMGASLLHCKSCINSSAAWYKNFLPSCRLVSSHRKYRGLRQHIASKMATSSNTRLPHHHHLGLCQFIFQNAFLMAHSQIPSHALMKWMDYDRMIHIMTYWRIIFTYICYSVIEYFRLNGHS